MLHFFHRPSTLTLLLVCLTMCVCRLPAQIDFTFSGLDENSQPAAATFTTAAHLALSGEPEITLNLDSNNVLTSTQYAWLQDSAPGAQQLFTTATGTFFSGDFLPGGQRIAGFGFEADATTGAQTFIFAIFDASDAGLGLVAGDNATLRLVYSLTPGDFHFAAPSDGIDAVTYFSAYTGTYDTSANPGGLIVSDRFFGGDGTFMTQISVTSVTIGTSAIPEPGTSAALVGVAALVVTACRRRRFSA